MNPVTIHVSIDRPREEVFSYLADIANHPEFCDHFLTDWHLTREDSVGPGAGARFRQHGRFNRFGFFDMNFLEVSEPHKIVAVGRGGKFNRIETYAEWALEPAAGGASTRLEYTYESDPPLPTDRLVEAMGGRRGYVKRNSEKALRRLRAILEENRDRGKRATIGGLDA